MVITTRTYCLPVQAPSAALAAGEFGAWLDGFRASLRDGTPVEPDEADALAFIPAESLVPMPGEPARRVLAHDASGRCSQLADLGCAVYAHRPRACRAYDCRIFPATGVRPDGPLIADQTDRWRFSYASGAARERHDAVRMAAVVLGFPGGLSSPVSPTQHALDAIERADEVG
jgi:Fe-S-cluster containining protein